ncbi:hybrid sensor histidine kinase/response regulator [Massilia sp. SYSU DXS3249]
MRIRTYLILIAAAIGIPVIIFSGVAIDLLLASERRAALRSLDESARATALVIDRELSSAEAALRVLAVSPALAAGDTSAFYHHARTADRGNDGRTILFAPNGQQLINTVLPLGSPLPPPPDYVTTRIQQVIRTQKVLVSGMMSGAVQKKPVTTINVPVPLDGGRRYVLASVFGTTYFQKLLAQRPVPPSWKVAITDRSGRFVARSWHGVDLLGQRAGMEALQQMEAGPEGRMRYTTKEGIDVYGAFTRSAMSGWTVSVSAPAGEIDAAARRALVMMSLGLLLTLGSALAVASFFGRRLLTSLAHATDAAAALAGGRVPAPDKMRVAEVDELHHALQDAGAVLAAAGAERSASLQREQEARALAERQNQSKDEFLAMLGHELRNPLSGIMGALQLMELPGVHEDRKARARDILRRQAGHLTHIVDDLLDVARLSQGKIRLEMQAVDLAAATQATADALRAAGRVGHAVTLALAPAWVMADRTRLDQVINNLLTNALKYTPAGGAIHVHVGAEEGQAVLSVRDTGIGISAELLPRLFDIFTQGAVSLDRSEGGLGIGLALVRQLVQLHGGTIDADSAGAHQGSVFTVRLPLAQAPAPALAPEAAHAGPSGGPAGIVGCSVLLVEDNEDARELLAAKQAAVGARVVQAADGMAGLEAALGAPPDVAVIDVGLPLLDGYALARRLRAAPATAGVGLIALTGYGQEADRRAALEAGFDSHFVKPVRFERLLEDIGRLASSKRQAPLHEAL